MKKFICVLLSIGMLAASAPGMADDMKDSGIKVTLNGEKIDFDVSPVIENDRILVPMRAIFEALGCAVSYQRYDGKGYVCADKGDNSVILAIGEKGMFVGGKQIELDAAAKIENNRTLVPLRAVSEGLDCDVAWNNDTKTAEISKKSGQYEIKSGNLDSTYTLDNGTDLMYISCSYPIIQGGSELNSSFIETVNESYRTQAEDYIKKITDEFAKDAKLMYGEMKDEYRPMNFSLSYEVTTNRKDLLSITTYDYENASGAHPTQILESKTFQMILCKELSLEDVFDKDDIEKNVTDAFYAQFEADKIEITQEIKENVAKEAENVNWYLTDDSLVMYFNQYQAGPYALGRPQTEILYTGSDGAVKLDLSEADMEEFNFEIEANPTTGYNWEVYQTDSSKIEVKSEYVADDAGEEIVGRGGKCRFSVKGIGAGNTVLSLRYRRSFESEESAIHELTYKLYISKDNKITVIDRIYK